MLLGSRDTVQEHSKTLMQGINPGRTLPIALLVGWAVKSLRVNNGACKNLGVRAFETADRVSLYYGCAEDGQGEVVT